MQADRDPGQWRSRRGVYITGRCACRQSAQKNTYGKSGARRIGVPQPSARTL